MSKISSRYPYLDNEPLVNGVYLRLLVDSLPEDFHVPLEPRVFAYALKRELVAADHIIRMRIRLYQEHPSLALATVHPPFDVKITDKQAIMLHLGASRLLQCWALPEDVWCTVLAPQLISNLNNCIFMMVMVNSKRDPIPPPIEGAEGDIYSSNNNNNKMLHGSHHHYDNNGAPAEHPTTKTYAENSEKSGVGVGVDDDALSAVFVVAASAVIALARSLNHRLLTSSSSSSEHIKHQHHTICEDDSEDGSDEEEEEEEEDEGEEGEEEGVGEDGSEVGGSEGEDAHRCYSLEEQEPELRGEEEGEGMEGTGRERNGRRMEEEVVTRQQRGSSVASLRSVRSNPPHDHLHSPLSVRWSMYSTSTSLHPQGSEGLGQVNFTRRVVVMESRGPGQLLKASATALAQLILMAGACVEQTDDGDGYRTLKDHEKIPPKQRVENSEKSGMRSSNSAGSAHFALNVCTAFVARLVSIRCRFLSSYHFFLAHHPFTTATAITILYAIFGITLPILIITIITTITLTTVLCLSRFAFICFAYSSL